MKRYQSLIISVCTLAFIGTLSSTFASQDAKSKTQSLVKVQDKEQAKGFSCWVTAVEPKQLTSEVRKGLDWIVKQQHNNGGWGQGDESQIMGRGMANLAGKPNVADSCAAILALIRSGSTPSEGSYAEPIRRGLEYLFSEIEASDEKSLSITSVKGTRVQGKLGQFIDTFMAPLILSEAKGHMPDDAGEKRLFAALDKVLNKIEINQKEDGTWNNQGWAPVLAQSMAAKGMNRAAQVGFDVNIEVLARSEEQARKQVDGDGGGLRGAGSAGVALYAGAANLSTLQDSSNRNAQREGDLRKIVKESKDDSKVKEAMNELARFDLAEIARDKVQRTIVDKLDDKQFIAGFGSNGGEEFLSYMNIGESLVVKGGNDWTKWDTSMTENLNRIQNNDGSWSGHHCITGKTFCTSTALLTLMVDRTPVPADALTKAE